MKKRTIVTVCSVCAALALCAAALRILQKNGNAQYPIESAAEITYWIPTVDEMNISSARFNERPLADELRKQTGIQVTFLQPQSAQADETFAKMIATNNLPDIIEYKWDRYPGGVRKALEDGTILDLRPFLHKELQDYEAYLSAHPEGKKSVYLDTGECPLASQLVDTSRVYYGPMVRRDWLDALGLPLPETIDEWEVMLDGFKREFHAEKPLSISFNEFESHSLIGAWGVTRSLYQENGTVRFGPLEDGYYAFLQRMHAWYEKGLLDRNFAACDLDTTVFNILEEASGATFGYMSASLPLLDRKLKETNPSAEIVPLAPPSLVKGEPAKISFIPSIKDPTGTAITKNCQTPSLAAQFLNFGYTAQGSATYTYGIEGISYLKTKDGLRYTDEVLHNPYYTVAQMLNEYTRSGKNTPAAIDQRAADSYTQPKQKEGMQRWSHTLAGQYLLPQLTPASSEAVLIAKVSPALTKLENDFFMRSIIEGVCAESEAAFRKDLAAAGAADLIRTYQAMYDRYRK